LERAGQRRVELHGRVDGKKAVLARPFVGTEKVQLVLDDRAAERAAELVPLVAWIRAALVDEALGEEVVARHLLVAEELERVAAELVGPALDDDVHHAAGTLAVLRGHLCRVYREFA